MKKRNTYRTSSSCKLPCTLCSILGLFTASTIRLFNLEVPCLLIPNVGASPVDDRREVRGPVVGTAANDTGPSKTSPDAFITISINLSNAKLTFRQTVVSQYLAKQTSLSLLQNNRLTAHFNLKRQKINRY